MVDGADWQAARRMLGKTMRQTGIVKFFNRDKGFGFITPEDGGKDVFVHASTVQRAGVPYLEEGMALSFEVNDDPRGRGQQATILQLI
jgi:cold shock protein